VVGVVGGGSVAEGGGPAYLTVTLSAAERRPVQVGYVVTGDGATPAVDSTDYRLTAGPKPLTGRSGTIEFRPGETVKQVRVDAVDDVLREGTESLRFTLFRPGGCTIDSANGSVDLTVLDNDAYTAAIVATGASDVTEGGIAQFAVQLSSPATRSETFYVSTQDGSATAGTGDYRPLRDMPVTILAGQTRSLPFSLTTVVDDIVETDEYFLVSARPRSADIPAIDPVGVTILGTGPAPVTVSVSDASVKEGNAGLAACTFTIRLGAPALAPIVVQYATSDGTATAGSDYVAASGSITFDRGQISKTVTVNAIGDDLVEGTETFRFTATTTNNGSTASATGTGSILDDDSGFQVVVTFPDSSLSAAQQQVFRTAARRWSEVIIGDLPDVTVGGRVIDDIEITATGVSIDGAYGILGQAGPRTFRDGSRGLPITGVMQFDTADISMMMADGTFQNVILHEMGHVLGIGTLWSGFGLLTGAGTTDPRYVGTHALAEYRTLLGTGGTATGVPVENVGGSGSVGSHWRESVFDSELMTSVAERAGVAMPISRMTVGSLEDLGYRVNYQAADPYTLPAPVTAAAVARSPSLSATLAMALDQQRTKPVLKAAAFARLA